MISKHSRAIPAQQPQFKRKYRIKDLFRYTEMLHPFKLIRVESLSVLLRVIDEELLPMAHETIYVPIENSKELHTISHIFRNSKLDQVCHIQLEMAKDLFYQFLQNYQSENIDILITDKPVNLLQLFSEHPDCPGLSWIQSHRLYFRFRINRTNLETLNQIPPINIKYGIRFFDIDFDYHDLNRLRLSELPKVEFWLNQLLVWVKDSHEHDQIVIHHRKPFHLSCFIDNQLTLSYNPTANQPKIKMLEWKEATGESVSYSQLATYRKWIDLEPKVFYRHPGAEIYWSLVNLQANQDLGGDITQIPLITTYINELMRRIYK